MGVLKISDWTGRVHHLLLPSCAILEPSWAQVGANWYKLGRSWGLAGRSRPQVGPMLPQCWMETVFLQGAAICKICKLPVPCTFWRPFPGEHGPSRRTTMPRHLRRWRISFCSCDVQNTVRFYMTVFLLSILYSLLSINLFYCLTYLFYLFYSVLFYPILTFPILCIFLKMYNQL